MCNIIVIYNGQVLETTEDWHQNIYTGGRARQWKPGKSAESLARYVCEHDGVKKILHTFEKMTDVQIDYHADIICHPEHKVDFDEYDNGRKHDLVIKAKAKDGRPVSICIEAKVDETYGHYVRSEYAKAHNILNNGGNTNLHLRIEQLGHNLFGTDNVDDFAGLRYQLLHTTAGTLAANEQRTGIFVFMTLTFVTEFFNQNAYENNKRDLNAFVQKLDPTMNIGEKPWCGQFNIMGKQLFIIADKVNLLGH